MEIGVPGANGGRGTVGIAIAVRRAVGHGAAFLCASEHEERRMDPFNADVIGTRYSPLDQRVQIQHQIYISSIESDRPRTHNTREGAMRHDRWNRQSLRSGKGKDQTLKADGR